MYVCTAGAAEQHIMSVCYRMRNIETEPIMTKERDDDDEDDDNGMVGVHEGNTTVWNRVFERRGQQHKTHQKATQTQR